MAFACGAAFVTVSITQKGGAAGVSFAYLQWVKMWSCPNSIEHLKVEVACSVAFVTVPIIQKGGAAGVRLFHAKHPSLAFQ